MEDLFEKNANVDTDVKRNINSLRKSENLFDDLFVEADFQEIAIAAEARVKQHIPFGMIERGFHYTTGILFPFESENYQRTRYSDGSFGCWYGSMDVKTTIYETAYHNLKNELNIEGLNTIIERQRAIYNVHCQGILLDFRGKQVKYPELISQDYDFTQQVGRRLSKQGHPGLLAPSARYLEGVNVAVFNPKILSNPRLSHFLTYFMDTVRQEVRVEKEPGSLYHTISFNSELAEI